MRNIYAVLFRENKLIVKSRKREEIIEYRFDDIVTYPNVPFYANLFQDKIDIKEVRKYLKSSLKGDMLKNLLILKPIITVGLPDDITDIEKRAISDFTFQLFNSTGPLLVYESTVLPPIEEVDYISIYRSCRMFVLTYIKGRGVASQKFIENKDYTVDELKILINDLHDDCTFNKLNVYINGEGVEKYSVLGKVVEKEELLENVLGVSNFIGKKRRKV